MAITGIGGLFIRARDPQALSAWYKTHLGIDAGGLWQQGLEGCVLAGRAPDGLRAVSGGQRLFRR
mgnify:CR=1 FL=1